MWYTYGKKKKLKLEEKKKIRKAVVVQPILTPKHMQEHGCNISQERHILASCPCYENSEL